MTAPFRFDMRTALVHGPGAIQQLGALSKELRFHRTLLVTDSGLVAAGHAVRAEALLNDAGVEVFSFHDFGENPDSRMVEHGRVFAEKSRVDSIVALGGGSSLDCAKGINFVLSSGGRIHDYWGHGKATKPMLPMIGVPTTTGTGSEAQSYALISDAETHRKMACGDDGAAFRIAVLDPELAATQPLRVRAVTGYDAISHAVETWVTTKRSSISSCFSREAWRLLHGSYERAVAGASDMETISAMQLGSFYAGLAIENSMLGAAHACANPLTQQYGTVHGVAIGLMLSHVVTWNAVAVRSEYDELHPGLAARVRDLARSAGLPVSLREANVPVADLPVLARQAAEQWTGRFNPRPFDVRAAEEIYESAW